jgi:arsenical pump membrane protein
VVSAIAASPLMRGGGIALAGIIGTALLLLIVSALDRPLGAWTCAAGAFTAGATLIVGRQNPGALVRSVSWSILPLVAGLFVLVEALDRSGVVALLADRLAEAAQIAPDRAAAGSAVLLAIATNLTNNLPAGLVAAGTIAHAAPPQQVTDALLIAVDLGPNLSITGSLATILWLSAIRREGQDVGFWRFLKVGAAVMPPALILALAGRLI